MRHTGPNPPPSTVGTERGSNVQGRTLRGVSPFFWRFPSSTVQSELSPPTPSRPTLLHFVGSSPWTLEGVFFYGRTVGDVPQTPQTP